ncbi:hypothetical protein O181_088414 [Austropuccinia psidii MF-1]|uniref:Integrase catalytic domain-containing protein n=1 Tax=Austropuccinia psidii MF-1 TaxID=1389203 RepID=A0A9Q3IRL0_9BASI|nr:hypothetical protein [Austropuccinia psidii MF-1]
MQYSVLRSSEKVVEPMNVATDNLMGKFEDAVPYGGRYAITIQDMGLKYGDCHILTQKSDSTPVLLKVMAMWEKKTVKKIKAFRSNNFRKLCNFELENWCHIQGTVHEKSLPYNHKQNGFIEKYNRTIADIGRTLLCEYSLRWEFWEFAFTSSFQERMKRCFRS